MDVKYSERFYKNLKVFFKAWMRVKYRIECTGLENIPKDTPYILAGNHLNILDSWLLITVTNENLRFMVDKKLYNYKIEEWFFKKLGTFEVDPNPKEAAQNFKAMQTAVRLLRDGEKVAIFPEGRTHSMDVKYKFKDGASLIAKMSKTVIVPFGIEGTYRPFTKLKIVFGEPIDYKELNLKKEEENDYLENTVRNLEPFDHTNVVLLEDKKEDIKTKKLLPNKKCD